MQECSAHAVPGSVLPHSLNDESRSPLYNKGPLRNKKRRPQWERTLTERGGSPCLCLCLFDAAGFPHQKEFYNRHEIPVWWRRAVLPSLPWVVCFLSFFSFSDGLWQLWKRVRWRRPKWSLKPLRAATRHPPSPPNHLRCERGRATSVDERGSGFVILSCAIRPTRKNIDVMPAAAAEPACLVIRLVSFERLPGDA